MFWKKILYYLNIFGKGDPNAKGNINLKMMHGINRISLLMFLIAVIYLLIRHIF